MFNKILYPTDFSDSSNKVLDYLIQLKNAGAEEVLILHVIDTRLLHVPEIYRIVDMSLLGEKQALAAKRKALAAARKLKAVGLKTHIRIITGIPFREILKLEQKEGVSLTVMGSHGTSNVQEMLLGSVVEKVVRKAQRPVLVVRR
jgi:nucleotide-binding universal stress UspA family protein